MRPIPTLAQLYAQILATLQAEFRISVPVFGLVFLRPYAAAIAGMLHLFYLALGNLQKNIFVDTAEPEAIGGTLERFGRVKLGRNPFAARAGQYTCTVTGTTGSVINLNTTFKSDDASTSPGLLFIIDSAYTLPSGTGTITLRALTAGLEARLEVGDTLTATVPILGVGKTATVTAITVEPAAAEDTELYRARAIAAYQLEPQGGAAADYRLWSADAQGVQQVYPYAKSGAVSEIDLYVEATVADSTDGKGTPSASLLTDVEDVVNFDPDTTKPINERGRRPLGAIVNYIAITPLDITVEVVSYQNLTASAQTSIEAAIAATINQVRPFVSAADVLVNKNDVLDTNKLTFAIISAQPGSLFTNVNLYVNGVLTPSYTFTLGNIPALVAVNFV